MTYMNTNQNKITLESSLDDSDIYTRNDDDDENQSSRSCMKDVSLSHHNINICDIDVSSTATSTVTEAEDLSPSRSSGEEDHTITGGQNDNIQRKLPSSSGKQGTNFCCICQRIVTPIVIILIITLFLIYYFGDSSTLQGIIPGTDALFSSEDLGEQYVWNGATNTKDGLTMKILNALDTQWHTYFDIAVSDWDSGTPDALTLTSDVASAPDPACTMVEGIIKMCNDDYGAVDWMGVNEVLQYDGTEISGSTGIMNDYYFSTSSRDNTKRQYTMCHEMGHGFGLPHTDTAMWNRNQGNCLDYTTRPKQNMRPGQVNYDRLVSVYGVVGGVTNTSTTTGTTDTSNNVATSAPSNSNSNINNSNNNNNNNNDDDNTNSNGHGTTKNKNNNRILQEMSSKSNDNNNNIPPFIHERIRQIRTEYSTIRRSNHNNNGQRTLLRSGRSSSTNTNRNDYYSVDLGSGYILHVQFTKAY